MEDHAADLEMLPNAAYCYLFGILFPLIYFIFVRRGRQKPFLRFHSFQSLLLMLTLAPGSFSHGLTEDYIAAVWSVICFVAWVVCVIQGLQRKWFHLPLLGALAEWFARRT